MRIHRIALRNYRGVRCADISLASNGVTIIQGPNEVGKSSLSEALLFLFDEPHTSTKSKLKAVKPVDIDAGPSVEAELTTGPYHLVYSKQWHVGAKTELKILTPAPANHTGREAHDRVLEILDETLDRALFGAMRYQQGVSITQAALGNSRTLAAALDAAATGGALGGDDEADLFARIEKERALYFTGTGRPVVERVAAAEKAATLRKHVAELEAELRGLDTSAERHRQIGLDLGTNVERQTSQLAIIRERRAVVDELTMKEQAVDRLGLLLGQAQERATASRAVSEARQKLIDDAAAADKACADIQKGLDREAQGLEAARTAQTEAFNARTLAREARERAEAESKRANADFEHFRDVLDQQLLIERHGRAEVAEASIRKATEFIDGCLIDQDKLDEIEQASLADAEARGRASVEHLTLTVDALQPLRVQIEHEVVDLEASGRLEKTVARDIEFTLGDVARVTISGQQSGQALQEAAQAAEEDLAALFEAVGIAGADALRQAQALVRQRSEQERSLAAAETALHENLRDLTLQLVAEKIARYEEKIATYQAERDPLVPLAADMEEAKKASEAASASVAEARRGEEQRQGILEQAEALANGLQEETTGLSGRLDFAKTSLGNAEARLEAARHEATDAETETQREIDEGAAAEAADAHTRGAADLEAGDPASARTLLENAEAALGRLHDDHRVLELELAGITGELDVRGQAGLADQLAAAQSESAQLEKTTTLTERRAAAAQLLHARLSAHRDAARRSYVAPFKQQIEAFARIVFGPTVSIEVDHDTLEVISRTLEGVTIPYDSLSSGAKEQLCVLARLACAALVSAASADEEDRGVPVIFDDALGYSDAGRLERLGAAFSVAGNRSQVVVLTCVPERYNNIGSATVIRFDQNAAGPAAA